MTSAIAHKMFLMFPSLFITPQTVVYHISCIWHEETSSQCSDEHYTCTAAATANLLRHAHPLRDRCTAFCREPDILAALLILSICIDLKQERHSQRDFRLCCRSNVFCNSLLLSEFRYRLYLPLFLLHHPRNSRTVTLGRGGRNRV